MRWEHRILFPSVLAKMLTQCHLLIDSEGNVMKHSDSIAARCPVCGKGRVIDIGPKANAGQFVLCGPGSVNQAVLIAKCPKCGQKVGIMLREIKII